MAIPERDANILTALRKTVYWDMKDELWTIIEEEVAKAGGIRSTKGAVQTILLTGMQKAARGFGGDRSAAGRYAAQQRWAGHTPQQGGGMGRGGAMQETSQMRGQRAGVGGGQPQGPQVDVIANTPEEAIEALQQGKTVAFTELGRVNTLIDKLREFAQNAKKTGKKASLNLCQISIPGTNLFCGASLKDETGAPMPREKMPQLAGHPRKGSPADDEERFPKGKDGQVDLGKAFEEHLKERGIAVRTMDVPAATLKASQGQLDSAKVASLMEEGVLEGIRERGWSIYVSSDGYVIDGHHRWAATVGADAKDGSLGNTPIRVTVLDMPIQEVLKEANVYTEGMGIKAKGMATF
jgi:hypothetical protein